MKRENEGAGLFDFKNYTVISVVMSWLNVMSCTPNGKIFSQYSSCPAFFEKNAVMSVIFLKRAKKLKKNN